MCPTHGHAEGPAGRRSRCRQITPIGRVLRAVALFVIVAAAVGFTWSEVQAFQSARTGAAPPSGGVRQTTPAAVSNLVTATSAPESPSMGSVADGISGLWAVIGDSTNPANLSAERAAGINAKVVRLSWRDYMSGDGLTNTTYVASKQMEFAQLRDAGFSLILDVGLQNTPRWLHQSYPNSYYVDQFGETYTGDPSQPDQGDANLVFNPVIRNLAADYLRRIFADFGTSFAAVRLGGGNRGELTYPPATNGANGNLYWAFDANARIGLPTPNWRPGQPQSSGEAATFLNWYLSSLVWFQDWQISTVRQWYSGPIMMLYPGWGIRPGQVDQAVADDLDGGSSAEVNGEIQGGRDFARLIGSLNDPHTIVTTTWLDADVGQQDNGSDPRNWSPVHYLSTLANPLGLSMYGENTGQGTPSNLALSFSQRQRYSLIGLDWYNEAELLSGQYASLSQFAQAIASVSS